MERAPEPGGPPSRAGQPAESPQLDPRVARRRERLQDVLNVTAGLVGGLGGAFWVYVQEGFGSNITRAVVPALVASAVLLRRPGRARTAGKVLLTVLLVGLLSRFYYRAESPEYPPYAFPRLDDVPWGNGLLALSAFVSLTCLLGWGLGAARRRPQQVVVAGYALALVFAAGVAVDTVFVNRAPHIPPIVAHPFLVYPLTGPGQSNATYAYAHAQERTVFDLREVAFDQQKPPGTLRVVLCGASTMWGHNLETSEAFGAVLQRLLAAELPERRVEVLTVAHPGKYQLNELIDTVVTLPHWDPDLVISFNGINELWYGEAERGYFEGMPGAQGLWNAQLTARWQLGRLSFLGAYLRPRAPIELPEYGLRDRNVYEVPRYFSYLRGTARNLEHLGVPYVYAFCPNVSEKPLRTAAEQGFCDDSPWLAPAAERRRLAAMIVTGEGQVSYDVMAVFADDAEQAFQDPCHFTARGVERVCRDLAPRVRGWLGHR